MAKSVSAKKADKTTAQSPAAYAAKDIGTPKVSKNNASKYAPGNDSDLNVQSLDPEDGLLKLFTDAVKDLYWAENQLVKALPKMARAAASPDLAKAFLNHLEQTKTHVTRLEQVFDLLGKTPKAKKCDAMEGLTKEGEGVIEETDMGTPARDMGIIMASQKVEHYEISAYTGLITLAVKFDMPEISDILSSTLTEEIDSDELLANIADEILSSAGNKNQ